MKRHRQFDAEHEGFAARQAPLPAGASGLHPFTERLHVVWWPMGFKVIGVNTYDGKANPAQWLTLYEIAVKVVGGGGRRRRHGELSSCHAQPIYK